MGHLKRFKSDNQGATAIEYGIIAGAIGLVIIIAAGLVGVELTNTFTDISSNL